MVIRQEQMAVFEGIARKDYEQQACRHLRRHFALRLRQISEEELHDCVSRTIDRSALYGVTTRRDCSHFLNIATVLGWNFDDVPEHAWVVQCLRNPLLGTVSNRIYNIARSVEADLRRAEKGQ